MSSWTRRTVEGTSLTIEDSLETDNACVIEGARHLHILKHDRREAAQALAGDEWRVVPAMPDWERELLVGQAAQEEIDQLKRDYDALEKRMHEAEAQTTQPDETVDQGRTVTVTWHDQVEWVGGVIPSKILADAEHGLSVSGEDDGQLIARVPLPERYSTRISLARLILGAPFDLTAQPDRPEPVDPSEVRVGDVVEIEYDAGEVPGYMVRGEVCMLATGDGSRQRPFAISMPGTDFWPRVLDATVRVLHRAEPEPDPAAVEALYQVHEAASEAVTDEGSNTYRTDDLIRELVRRGVQVVSRDA